MLAEYHGELMMKLGSFRLPENFRGRNAIVVQLWWLVQSTLFSLSPQFMYGWRRFLLRCFGAEIGDGVIIRPTVKVTYPWKLRIGNHSWVGDDVVLYTLGNIHIGNNSVISQKSYLCTGSHDYNSCSFDIYAKAIRVGDGVWLASDVFVAPGVVIESGVVVGARSSVFKDMPKDMICMGNPATPVKSKVQE